MSAALSAHSSPVCERRFHTGDGRRQSCHGLARDRVVKDLGISTRADPFTTHGDLYLSHAAHPNRDMIHQDERSYH